MKSQRLLILAVTVLLFNSPGYSNQADTSQEGVARSDLALIRKGLFTYRSISSAFPTTEQGLKALTTAPRAEPIPEKWRIVLEELPSDPWGREYQYTNPSREAGKPFDLWSAGPDGKDGTKDDIQG